MEQALPDPWLERRWTPLIPESFPKIQSPAPDPKKTGNLS
jgi:hypothetical protein